MRTLTQNSSADSSATDQPMNTLNIWLSNDSRNGSLFNGRSVSHLRPSRHPVVLDGQSKSHDSKGVHPDTLNEATRYTLEEARGDLDGRGRLHSQANQGIYQNQIQYDSAVTGPSQWGCL